MGHMRFEVVVLAKGGHCDALSDEHRFQSVEGPRRPRQQFVGIHRIAAAATAAESFPKGGIVVASLPVIRVIVVLIFLIVIGIVVVIGVFVVVGVFVGVGVVVGCRAGVILIVVVVGVVVVVVGVVAGRRCGG